MEHQPAQRDVGCVEPRHHRRQKISRFDRRLVATAAVHSLRRIAQGLRLSFSTFSPKLSALLVKRPFVRLRTLNASIISSVDPNKYRAMRRSFVITLVVLCAALAVGLEVELHRISSAKLGPDYTCKEERAEFKTALHSVPRRLRSIPHQRRRSCCTDKDSSGNRPRPLAWSLSGGFNNPGSIRKEHAYMYECPGTHKYERVCDIYSLGPNGKGGDEAIRKLDAPRPSSASQKYFSRPIGSLSSPLAKLFFHGANRSPLIFIPQFTIPNPFPLPLHYRQPELCSSDLDRILCNWTMTKFAATRGT